MATTVIIYISEKVTFGSDSFGYGVSDLAQISAEKVLKNSFALSLAESTKFHILIGKFSYFINRFLNHIFFVINFSYFVTRFLLSSSMVKSDNEIGKVNDKKNMI